MVGEKCDDKLEKVTVPENCMEGPPNTTDGGGPKIDVNKLLAKKNSSRNPNYTPDEDKYLCQVYIKISQHPDIGIEKKDQFWNRVSKAYNDEKPNSSMPNRSSRSIESRMQVILSATSKFKGCIRLAEYNKPTDASEYDIIHRAKQMMIIDPKFSKGFKFEHVWDILKDFEKFEGRSHRLRVMACSSQSAESETPVSESPMLPVPESPMLPVSKSPVLPNIVPSFSISSSDDSGSGYGSQRALGLKKSKLKRKNGDDISALVSLLKETHKKMLIFFESSIETREEDRHIQREKIEAQKMAAASRQLMAEQYKRMNDLAQKEAEYKILMMDTESISDSTKRSYFEKEQARILSKRQEQVNQSTPPNDNFAFGRWKPY